MTGHLSTSMSKPIPNAYMDLARSNVCPPSKARTTIIGAHEHQCVSIQERLKDCPIGMEHHRAHTKDTPSKLHATLSSINRLPPEILSEIFEQCLAARHSVPLFSLARSKEAPLLLGRVCRSWRTVAFATPRLWRDIVVNICDGRYSDELRKDVLPVLQTWVAHSGGLPLNLVILCKTERVLPGLKESFSIIQANAARWRTVSVRLQNSPVIYKLLCRTFSKSTSLSMFDVTDGGQLVSFANRQSEDVEDAQPLSFDLSSAPLCHLSVSLTGLGIRDVRAPWATLTRLLFMQDARSSPASITDYVAVLRSCILLKECSITIDGGFRDTPLESFMLPNLESLEVRVLREASYTAQMGDFLNVLNAPRLQSLTIEDFCPRREIVLYHSQLKRFLRTHAQSLRRFKFSTSSKLFSSADLIVWISETPLLTELEYHPDEDSSLGPVLEALTPHVQGEFVECLLPCLTRCFIYWDTTETVSMVGDMIEKRFALVDRGIARLNHLSCKPVKMSIGYSSMPPHVLVENLATRLEPLCRCGLQVDWEAYRYDLEFWYC